MADRNKRQAIDDGSYCWQPILWNYGTLYTRAGAQRIADQRARQSRIRGAVGAVCDTGRGFWRISVGGK